MILLKWDITTGKMVQVIKLLPEIFDNGECIEYSEQNEEKQQHFKKSKRTNKRINTISCSNISDTKKLLIVGSLRGNVFVFGIHTGGLVYSCFPDHDHTIIFVAFHESLIFSVG